jgi:5-methylcytosine-specific restriction endonuclease McrA
LASLVARDRATTALLIAHLAEVERRELHLPAGCDSLLTYCVEKLRLSRDEAIVRICAARLARRFPVIFAAIADGRLTLTTTLVLRKHLRRENARELLRAAMNRTKSEVVAMLAARFPKSELLPLVDRTSIPTGTYESAVAPERLNEVTPAPMEPAAPRVEPAEQKPASSTPKPTPKLVPIAEERFGLHFSIGKELYDKLQYLQELLSHAVPNGDMVEVLDRATSLAIAALEKRKFGVGSRQRATSKPAKTNGRHIPLAVRRAVLARDGHRCTYVGTDGKRCTCRKRLDFHHVQEHGRGGEATVDNIRLLCRAHNQYEAEQTYGAGFMEEKREEARRRKSERGANAQSNGLAKGAFNGISSA